MSPAPPPLDVQAADPSNGQWSMVNGQCTLVTCSFFLVITHDQQRSLARVQMLQYRARVLVETHA
jgi:hypothetical protein